MGPPQLISQHTKDQVKELIRPYAHSPSVDLSNEVVLVSCLALEGGRASLRSIITRAMAEFDDIRKTAAESLIYHHNLHDVKTHDRSCSKSELSEPRPFNNFSFRSAFRSFDNPLTWHEDTWEWSITEAKTRILLDLYSPPEGTFPLLSLPPELRQRIYDMVLCFRPFVITQWFHRTDDDRPERPVLHAGTGTIHGHFPPYHSSRAHQSLPPLDELLAIVSVNKQLYREALPTFYAKNLWWFHCLEDLKRLLAALPPSHSRHIKHVALDFCIIEHIPSYRRKYNLVSNSIRRLVDLPNLSKLWLTADEAELCEEFGLGEEDDDVGNIPGFGSLMDLRGLEEVVVFGDDCEWMKRKLPPLLTAPKDIDANAVEGKEMDHS